MADTGDLATEMYDKHVERSLANRPSQSGGSLKFCIDCDDEIPEKRRKVGNIKRCVMCQEAHEVRGGR